MRGVKALSIDEDDEEQGNEERHAEVEEASRERKAEGAECDSEEEDGEVGDPELLAGDAKGGCVEEVEAGRSVLEEVAIDALAVLDAEAVDPEEGLISTEE
jgi:hypothetical protein